MLAIFQRRYIKVKLEPKPLKKGWFIRTLVTGLTLLSRSSAEWVCLGVVVPILMMYVPFFSIKALCWSLVVVAAVVLSLRSDHHDNPLMDTLQHLFRNKRFFYIDLAALLVIYVLIDLFFKDVLSVINDRYFASGLALLMLKVSVCFVLVPYALIKLMSLKLNKEQGKSLVNEDLLRSAIPTFFTLHVMIDMKLDWKEACAMAMTGYWVMGRNRRFIYLMLLLVFIFPPAAIVVFPWFYAIYKELFWQTGITDRQRAGVSKSYLLDGQI